jgi:hypothetical protein
MQDFQASKRAETQARQEQLVLADEERRMAEGAGSAQRTMQQVLEESAASESAEDRQ